ncbi:prepilin peptidase [Amycolatopsis sp.]|uniref:prepilin peptidase n=1 Tax=Amycolatopsis sp. TaxID=37632 RepID=UPI002C1FDF2B|nr:prepilin peptidase [Amycolatopsis sp.]HVV13041.1 prepilin peptidase [Amycolatopsis sp.]
MLGILAAFVLAAIGTGFLLSSILARARSPAPVPGWPVASATAVLWGVTAWRWLAGAIPPWWLPVPLVVSALAIPLIATDLRYQRVPNVLTLPAYPLLGGVLALAAVAGPSPQIGLRALNAAIVFGGLHLLIYALARRSLGAGDVKLAGSLGAVLGAVHWAALVVASVLAAVVTLLLALTRRWADGVPHGPGLLGATWLVSLFPATGTAST